MATTGTLVTATSGQRDFDVPFPYLDSTHVKVDVRGSPAAYEWINSSRLRLLVPTGAGDTVRLYRSTPIDASLVEFQAGATLTEADLNLAIRQTLFIQQELTDLYKGSLERATIRLGENLGVVTGPDELLSEVANMALADEVLERFRERIADIDLTAEAVMNVSLRTDALQNAVDALATLEDGTGIATVLQQERMERIEGDVATAATVGLIGAKSGDGLGFILDTDKVKVSPTESLASRFASIGTQLGSNLAQIQSETETRNNALLTLASRMDTFGTRLGQSEAGLVAEQRARATALEAEALARTQLAAKLSESISATYQSEARTRADADGVFTNQFALLGAKTADGKSWALDETKVKVAGGKSLGERLSGIDTQVGLVAASVVEERRAWSTATNSLSSILNGVVSTVGSHTTNITQLFEARDGLYGKAGVAIDNNGYITGWTLNNNGRSGSFIVHADRLALVARDGRGEPITPFEVTGSEINLRADVNVSGDLVVDGTLTHKAVQKNTLTGLTASYIAADLNINSWLGDTVIQEVYIDVEGPYSPVVLDFTCFSHARYDNSGSFTLRYKIWRAATNGSPARAIVELPVLMRTNSKVGNLTGMAPIKAVDRPGVGTWRYYVTVVSSQTNMDEHYVSHRFLSATEHKTNT